MNMSQLVIGSALGFIIAQGLLYSAKRCIGWLQRDEVRQRIRALTPTRWSNFIDGFIRHAGPIAASVALVTLGVWAARDYWAAKSAPSAVMASVPDVARTVPLSDPKRSEDEAAELALARQPGPSAAPPVGNLDPYSDSDFQVHRRSHRAGTSLTLKETLVRRSEEKARADLLSETQQHLRRSQYDCEAADRASRYIKVGLDVWGFATWQLKYFPVDSYTGATLPQCKDIKDVVDPSWSDLRSTVAVNHP